MVSDIAQISAGHFFEWSRMYFAKEELKTAHIVYERHKNFHVRQELPFIRQILICLMNMKVYKEMQEIELVMLRRLQCTLREEEEVLSEGSD